MVLSLGLGLTLLVTLALIDDNIHRQVNDAKPGVTPSFFFVDVPEPRRRRFRGLHRVASDPGTVLDQVPMMRGRITALNGVPADKIKAKEGATWVLEGDRGITYSAKVAERLQGGGGGLVAGRLRAARRWSRSTARWPTGSASRSATASPSTCSAAA